MEPQLVNWLSVNNLTTLLCYFDLSWAFCNNIQLNYIYKLHQRFPSWHVAKDQMRCSGKTYEWGWQVFHSLENGRIFKKQDST